MSHSEEQFDKPTHTDLERAILGAFEPYWWLGEKAGRQLAAAALSGLNGKGYMFWRSSPRLEPFAAIEPAGTLDGTVLEMDFSPDDHIVITVRLPVHARIGHYVKIIPLSGRSA